VLGIAIDMAEERTEEPGGEVVPGPAGQLGARTHYILTYQLAKPEALLSVGGGQGQGGGSGAPFYDLSTVADSLFVATRELATRSDKPLFFEHMQVLVLSEGAARHGLRDYVDFLLRDHEARRRVLVFVSKGPARDILDIQPKTGENTASLYLDRMTRNAKKTGRMANRKFLGDIVQSMRNGQDFVIHRVTAGEGEAKMAGAAAVSAKTGKMLGWLGEVETRGYNWLAGEIQAGVVEVPMPGVPAAALVWEISGASREIKATKGPGGNVAFEVRVSAEGSIGEIDAPTELPAPVTTEFMDRVSGMVAKQIQAEMAQTLAKMRGFGLDGMGFKEALAIQEPAYWKRVHARWHEEVWPRATVNLHVDVETRRSGVTK